MNKAPVVSILKKSSLIIHRSVIKLDQLMVKTKLPPFFKRKRVLLPLTGLIILILFFSIFSFSSPENNIPIYAVKKGKFLVTVTESGELRAKQSKSVIVPRVRGNVKIVYLVPEGARVNAGDTVVKFDPTEALTNLRDAESKLEIALSEKEKVLANQKSSKMRMESDLKSAELSYELSQLNLEQMKFEAEIKQQEAKLNHQRNELSYKKAKQDFESQIIINQSELNKIDIEVQQKMADLKRAKLDLESLTLISPAEGLVVYEINWGSGRKVAIGDTPWPGQTLLTLPDLSAMESLTFVNEVDVSRITSGLPVEIKLDAFQDSIFRGKISSVGTIGKNKDNNSSIKVFEIDVDILAQSSILKPGMTTSNKMIIKEIPNVIYVPQEAVFEKEGKKIVYILNSSGFDEQEVSVGEKSDNYIVITRGLEPGQELALRDPNEEINTQSELSGNSVDEQMPVKK